MFTDEELQAIAKEVAQDAAKQVERMRDPHYAYLLHSHESDWVPHAWVIEAMRKAQEASREAMAEKAMDAWVRERGQMSWKRAIEIIAILTKMPDEERDRLLNME